MSAARRALGQGLLAFILVGALVLPYVGGYPLAYGLMIAGLLVTAWQAATDRIVFTVEAGLFAGAWALTAIAFAANGDFVSIANLLPLLLFAPLASAFARFAGPRSVLVVAILALLGATLSFAVALWQIRWLGLWRAQGLSSDPIWSAQAAVILGALALMGLSAPGRRRHLFWLGPMLGTFTAVLGQSRGPLLAVPVLVGIGLIYAFPRRWYLVAAPALAFAALAIFTLGQLAPGSLQRIGTVHEIATAIALGERVPETSTEQRLSFYRAAGRALVESPLIGHGWVDKIDAVRRYTGETMLAEGHHHLHSDIADFIVSAGGLGIVAYVMLIAAPLAGAWRSRRDALYRPRLLGAVLLSAGYLCCGLTYLMFGYEFHTTLYVVLAAILVGYCREVPDSYGRRAEP